MRAIKKGEEMSLGGQEGSVGKRLEMSGHHTLEFFYKLSQQRGFENAHAYSDSRNPITAENIAILKKIGIDEECLE